MGWVFTPTVQQFYVAILYISSLKGALYYVLVVGKSYQLYASLRKCFLCYWESVCIRGYHTYYFEPSLAQSFYGFQRRAAGRDKVFYHYYLRAYR